MKITELTQCPACNNDRINTEIEFAPGLCTACGLVLTEEALSEFPKANDQSSDLHKNADDAEKDWKQSISVQDSSEQNLVELLERTETIGSTLDIGAENKIKAGEFAKQAWIESFTHGRSIDTVAAAAIILACRVTRKPCPIDVVAETADVRTVLLHNTWRILADEIEQKLQPARPSEYITFIRNQLDLPKSIDEKAHRVLDSAEKQSSGNPAGVAAGAIYIAVQETDSEVTYNELGQLVNLTKETIWRRADELREEIC